MSNPIPASGSAPVTLVQLTDSHLFAHEEGKLLGLTTQDSLQRVVQLVRQEQGDDIDLVLATGDLAQDGSMAAYERFEALTAPLRVPLAWTVGNHDDACAMRERSLGERWVGPVVDMGAWRIVMLETAVPNEVHGALSVEVLEMLDNALSTADGRHVLLAMHHHPVSVDSAWMDQIGLQSPEALFDRVDLNDAVRGIVWGHVHQPVDRRRGNVRLLASPSTCVQFKPLSETFEVTSEAPGYRWLKLHGDGSIDTGISRLTDFSFELDYASGY
ncbi:3',5'-cyclic-AMP phosphodiesterase [Pseudomonas sp. Marseille-QA0892]